MRKPAVLVAALAALLAGATPAAALRKSVNVNGKENLFAAGRNAVPPPTDGTLPHEIDFKAGPGQVMTASSVRGKIDTHCGVVDPDGVGACQGTDIESLAGISGMITGQNAMYLAGVFLTDKAPSSTAPPRLDFTPGLGLGQGFLELSPRIQQAFYIGDGLTGDGEGLHQRIHIPATATRLFLGFEDASAFQGQPCCYDDNDGGYRATVFIGEPPGRDEPQPQAGKTGVGDVSSGTVFVKRPGGRRLRLRSGQTIPVGSTVDTRRGSVLLKVSDGKGGVQAGTFSKGIFRFTQKHEKVTSPAGKKLSLLTSELKMSGGRFKSCPARKRAAGARRRAIRYLKAKASGRFRVIGKRSSGIERGTAWTTTDYCDSTVTKVTKGAVIVTDFALKQDIEVAAGNSYTARAPARRRR